MLWTREAEAGAGRGRCSGPGSAYRLVTPEYALPTRNVTPGRGRGAGSIAAGAPKVSRSALRHMMVGPPTLELPGCMFLCLDADTGQP